jgi:hypothetical protein
LHAVGHAAAHVRQVEEHDVRHWSRVLLQSRLQLVLLLLPHAA